MASLPTAQPERSLFTHSAAGKGDQDRSPGWRDNYDEIDWGHHPVVFEEHRGARQVKRYGPKPSAVITFNPIPKPEPADWRFGV